AIAWGFLAWTIGMRLGDGWKRIFGAWLVLGFASTLPVMLWLRSVLSESVSISLLAIIVGCFIWVSCHPRSVWIFATAASCLCFAATRDAQVWTILLVICAVGLTCLVSRPAGRQFRTRFGMLALCLLIGFALTELGQLASHRTQVNITDDYFVRVFPFPSRVAWFAAHGMPDQSSIDALAHLDLPPNGNLAKVVSPAKDTQFKDLYVWMNTHGTSVYVEWLALHPGELLLGPFQTPQQAYDYAAGNLTFYAPSQHVIRAPLTGLLWPGAGWLFELAAIDIVLAVVFGLTARREFILLVGVSLIGLISMLIAWQGDGQEVTRHTIEGFVEVRLGLWMLFAFGLTNMSWPKVRTYFGRLSID
ncbi:MAG TPA: hypothetical protein VMU77_05530, partial [Acidimicrobiales bacterium]|nr:hypothetical protein [Acidimicrobiales bacterium]